MSIPLDNFYQWVESCAGEPVTLYVFYPHGSKNIFNLRAYRQNAAWEIKGSPGIICHDQEPLHHEIYDCIDLDKLIDRRFIDSPYSAFRKKIIKQLLQEKNNNLSVLNSMVCNYYDRPILLHSEQNSDQLKWYEENNYIPAYHWSHGTIARDWYRFAQHDVRLKISCNPSYDFLIHCRDWSGPREYRLKFLELLTQHQLINQSLISFNSTCSDGYECDQHQFSNQQFALHDFSILSELKTTSVSSSASADYDIDQVTNCAINVVLETVFDTTTIHHTEKICRALACGQPFILAAAPGSLAVLRKYGFKTFSPWIDESYDNEKDSLQRLNSIVQSMKKFSQLCHSQRQHTFQVLKSIAQFNQRRFFSKDFENQLQSELIENLQTALTASKKHVGKNIALTKEFRKSMTIQEYHELKEILIKTYQWIRKNQKNRSSSSQ